ncbi:hypothetical protein N7495_002852 [Penicillium taxi]|uniref:uncharacterized protein n=1 Tax=Penicillium taxi TaxID=168475 RepID=UPI002545785C|nr:uncharacterized protein N7495_002852 [Penicillium taxi]KAJ5902324.1 hypothetical protein N7495_002852 [Penicillium taxi]
MSSYAWRDLPRKVHILDAATGSNVTYILTYTQANVRSNFYQIGEQLKRFDIRGDCRGWRRGLETVRRRENGALLL